MATCKKLTKTVKKLVEVDEVVDDGVELRLTQEEASFLLGAVGSIGGDCYAKPRRCTAAIYSALRSQGIKATHTLKNAINGYPEFVDEPIE